MKQIQAYIKEHKLNSVISSLRKIENISGLSVIERKGYGLGWLTDSELEMFSGVKLEIFCHDSVVDEVVSAIEKAAHTGLKGDGKIYVSTIDQAIRISTGDRGIDAV